jgi:hypothetical protein
MLIVISKSDNATCEYKSVIATFPAHDISNAGILAISNGVNSFDVVGFVSVFF